MGKEKVTHLLFFKIFPVTVFMNYHLSGNFSGDQTIFIFLRKFLRLA